MRWRKGRGNASSDRYQSTREIHDNLRDRIQAPHRGQGRGCVARTSGFSFPDSKKREKFEEMTLLLLQLKGEGRRLNHHFSAQGMNCTLAPA